MNKRKESLKDQIDEHIDKLNAYIADPSAFDNKGFLANAPNDDIKNNIIRGRINHLLSEIKNFANQIAELNKGISSIESNQSENEDTTK